MALRKRGRRGESASLRKNKTKTPSNDSEIKRLKEIKDKSERSLIVAQEIKIAQLLANNDKKIRDKVLKRLNKWLRVRSQSSFVFTKADFMSLWKGLFYCMWLSDKMLAQEELAESLSKLVHCLNSRDTVVLYTSCALQTLATEWFGIDHYRLDKFSMLARRILRQTFIVCKNQSWNPEWVTEISQVFTELFLHTKTGLGFNLHVTEIYLEELAKISNGNIPEDVVHEFIKPFVEYLITTNDERQMKHIMRYVFRYLIFQSDIGLDFMEKFKAWKEARFPCSHIDGMQKIEISDTEENSDNENERFSEIETQNEVEKPLDPRAGRVDVELPQLPFNAAKIVELLSTYKFHPLSTAKSRRQLLRILNEYTELSRGRMPLGIKSVRKPNSQKGEMDLKKAAMRLVQFEKNSLPDKASKKRKKENEKVTCGQVSINDSKNEDALKSNAVDSKSELIDTVATVKADLQDTDANTIPLKKRKSNSTYDITGTKSEVSKNKKKPRIETSKKSKAAKMKLNQKDSKFADKNVKHKTKKALNHDVQTSDVLNQYTSISPISSKKISLKKIKSKTKKTMSESNHQETSLKNVVPHQIKKETNLKNPIETKRVIFGLSRNTAQHKSEYLRQVRKSPGIPFDANKKPLVGVLKMSPIPSPLNPFYKKIVHDTGHGIKM